jgi:hypothetical protein
MAIEIYNIFKVTLAILVSLGGGGLIILALSNWLGKIWANRIMVKDRAEYAQELERLRAQLLRENEKELSNIRNELDIYKEKHLKGHIVKIETYRLGADILAEILGDLDVMNITGNLPLDPQKVLDPQILQRLSQLGRASLKLYGYLAISAPQKVMDANDELRDYLDSILYGGEKYEPAKVYQLALKLANEIRKDIGIDESPLEYKGKRYQV